MDLSEQESRGGRQFRVVAGMLFWGVALSLIVRLALILLAGSLTTSFAWFQYVFAILLLVAAVSGLVYSSNSSVSLPRRTYAIVAAASSTPMIRPRIPAALGGPIDSSVKPSPCTRKSTIGPSLRTV